VTAAALVLAIVGALLAAAIHITMPTFVLMAIRVGVSELSAYVILLLTVSLAIGLFASRDGLRIATIALALVGIVLARTTCHSAPSDRPRSGSTATTVSGAVRTRRWS